MVSVHYRKDLSFVITVFAVHSDLYFLETRSNSEVKFPQSSKQLKLILIASAKVILINR